MLFLKLPIESYENYTTYPFPHHQWFRVQQPLSVYCEACIACDYKCCLWKLALAADNMQRNRSIICVAVCLSQCPFFFLFLCGRCWDKVKSVENMWLYKKSPSGLNFQFMLHYTPTQVDLLWLVEDKLYSRISRGDFYFLVCVFCFQGRLTIFLYCYSSHFPELLSL